ncbi:hypothetical protein MRX96_020986 [Rhipicephalus microplus]
MHRSASALLRPPFVPSFGGALFPWERRALRFPGRCAMRLPSPPGYRAEGREGGEGCRARKVRVSKYPGKGIDKRVQGTTRSTPPTAYTGVTIIRRLPLHALACTVECAPIVKGGTVRRLTWTHHNQIDL